MQKCNSIEKYQRNGKGIKLNLKLKYSSTWLVDLATQELRPIFRYDLLALPQGITCRRIYSLKLFNI